MQCNHQFATNTLRLIVIRILMNTFMYLMHICLQYVTKSSKLMCLYLVMVCIYN